MNADSIVGRLALLGYRPDGVIAAGLGDGRVVLCNVVDNVKTLPVDRLILDRWGPWTEWGETKPSEDVRRRVRLLIDSPSRVVQVVPPERVGDTIILDHHRDTSIGGPVPTRQQFSQMLDAANFDVAAELPQTKSFDMDGDFLQHCLSEIVPQMASSGLTIDDPSTFCSLLHLERTGLMPHGAGGGLPVKPAAPAGPVKATDGWEAQVPRPDVPVRAPIAGEEAILTSALMAAAPAANMPSAAPMAPQAPLMGTVTPPAPATTMMPSASPAAPPANYSVVDSTGNAVGHHDNFKKAVDHAQAHSTATNTAMHVRDNMTGAHAASLFPPHAAAPPTMAMPLPAPTAPTAPPAATVAPPMPAPDMPSSMASPVPGGPSNVVIQQEPANAAAAVPGKEGDWQAHPTTATAPADHMPAAPNDAGLPTISPRLGPPPTVPAHGVAGGMPGVSADDQAPKTHIGKPHTGKMAAATDAIAASLVGGEPIEGKKNNAPMEAFDAGPQGGTGAPVSQHDPAAPAAPLVPAAPVKTIGKPHKKPKDMATAIGKLR
jgi:hypothetical protein